MDSCYEVDEKFGFLPPANVVKLSSHYDPWEEVAAKLHSLIDTRELRAKIDALPLLSTSHLTGNNEWRRAYVVLGFLAHSYIWAEGEEGLVQKLPQSISVPWMEVAKKLDMPTVMNYAACVLFNYELRNPERGLVSDNIKILNTFTGTRDEEWFYIGSILVEIAAVKGLNAIKQLHEAITNDDKEKLEGLLDTIGEALRDMGVALKETRKECKPEIFYGKIRFFFNGTTSKEHFPEGLLFEQQEGDPIKGERYGGASAGQSSTLPAFDAILGISHASGFFMEQRCCMPPPHREFLQELERWPSVREYVVESKNQDLKQKFNSCIAAIKKFRHEHRSLVQSYILDFVKKNDQGVQGTGGTELKQFLEGAIEESDAYV